MANLINSVKAILLYLMMFISACFGVVFIQTPCIPLAFLNRRRYLQLCSRALGYYLLMVTVSFLKIILDYLREPFEICRLVPYRGCSRNKNSNHW